MYQGSSPLANYITFAVLGRTEVDIFTKVKVRFEIKRYFQH